jgi:hemoglobin
MPYTAVMPQYELQLPRSFCAVQLDWSHGKQELSKAREEEESG